VPKDSKPPAFPFYVDDFASDGKVEAMTTEEVGAYILLLCKAWREDPVGSLPSDDRVLARWARLTSEVWSGCKPAVLSTFELRSDGRLYQKRMEREFRKMKESRRKRGRAASVAANTRWSDAKRMRNASESQCDDDAKSCLSSSISSSISISEKTKDKEPPHPPAKPGGVRRVREPRFDPLTLPIPESLNVPEFHEAWKRWISHRADIKEPLAKTMAQSQLDAFVGWGMEKTLRMINHTIFMGWQGLREPDAPKPSYGKATATSEADFEAKKDGIFKAMGSP
jgi:uncharacterized protein YdaU (DUF1376 family)